MHKIALKSAKESALEHHLKEISLSNIAIGILSDEENNGSIYLSKNRITLPDFKWVLELSIKDGKMDLKK